MLNYEYIILKRLANCYRYSQELYEAQEVEEAFMYWWDMVLCYTGILKAVYKESFTLLIDDNRFIAYCSRIRFTVNLDNYSIEVTSDELLHI